MEPKKEITEHLLKYILSDDCTDEEKEANPIPAQEVVDAIKAGKSVEIINAVIEGFLELESVVAKGKITIQRTKIKGPVDCSYVEFKQVVKFEGSIFQSGAIFKAATVEKDIIVRKAAFQRKADFSDFRIEGGLYGESTAFKEEADFTCARVGRDAVFTGAVFKQQTSFNSAQIKGAVFFDPATFEEEVDFANLWIGSVADFTGAIFRKRANFNGAQIQRHAFFRPATFEDEADFIGARIGGNAEFTGTLFKQQAIFNSAQIQGTAFFNPATFQGEANFAHARIRSAADFTKAIFRKTVIFSGVQVGGDVFFDLVAFEGETRFVGTMIGGNARFEGAQFIEYVTFYTSQFKMDTWFQGAVFAKDARFQNASFRTIFLAEPEVQEKTQFKGKIDLRGCTYDSIDPISMWEELMDKLEPYDRQPFTQLEGTFRRAGQESLANKVYYKRKCREFSLFKKRNLFTWIKDRFLWLLTGYGVKLRRLLVAFAIILLIGTFIFQLDGAVEPKLSLTYADAFWVSLNQFLPVAIPAGSEWKPSSLTLWGIIKFTTFATVLKLLGWILVPVGVAGLSGWLKR